MKNFLTKFLIVLTLCFSVSQIHCGSSSSSTSGTDQVSIPAPVTHLSISTPDASGLVRVTAEAGFADSSSLVILTVNPATSSSLLQKLFFDVAYASSLAATVTTDDTGAFQNTLAATAPATNTHTYL